MFMIHRGEITATVSHPSRPEIKVTLRKMKRLDSITQWVSRANLDDPGKLAASLKQLESQIIAVEGLTDETGALIAAGTEPERRALIEGLFEADELDIPRVIPAQNGTPETTIGVPFPTWLLEKAGDPATFKIDPKG